MSRFSALIWLGFNFVKEAFVSGGITALVILRGGKSLQPGFVRMPYGDLGKTAANFLGALVSLTPGTTTVDIDPGRQRTAGVLSAARRSHSYRPSRRPRYPVLRRHRTRPGRLRRDVAWARLIQRHAGGEWETQP